MKGTVYICDDEEGMLRYLRKSVSEWGYEVKTHSSALALLRSLAEDGPRGGVLLLDIRMPEMDGLEVLSRVKALRPELGVVMMTGYGTIDSAVEAIKLGAFDYLTKPFSEERLAAVIGHCLENSRLREEGGDTTGPCPSAPAEELVFASPRFRETFELAQRAAAGDVNVLLQGESGTGKELIAAEIHRAGPRARRCFLALNCAALNDNLLESQLFGHRKGAFTGADSSRRGLLEEADSGTLFLDEVAELSTHLQAKLLRVLQDGEFIPVGATRARRVDVRFVAATNKDLEQLVAKGEFREDLYYRLNVFSLYLPPLRERPEDVPLLARHFLDRASARLGREVDRISDAALKVLTRYSWPGNVRELRNVIERGAIIARGRSLTPDDLPEHVKRPQPGVAGTAPVTLAEAERRQVASILERAGWNKSQAARMLGITRRTLDRKILDYGLTPAP
ncbi:sigma-54-dependent transcriptional regulator [Desulfurivibrio alkaliphilus]|uniref:DNA-binding transcriptional regulator NtrC n=1 Tax=Desulfurivibrio alkaliphilus (strain DSM 19089 / UNIQEM U267 / AHT2) TaxID=589865 RepID=D6Z3F2_DESAT|nr:sigma-54 dependent transcriptional regulator [Desulfurivibrio alkaliphilus]ADH86077.1 two component, sigma54 specific, transcriptional regulator, Fis family [Desulfurivibrio alkaliphilus AHT 2]